MKITNLFTVLLLLGLIWTSCGNDDQKTPPVSPETSIDCPDNNVVVALPINTKTLNPLLYRTTYESQVLTLSAQYLMAFSPEEMGLVPQLAKAAPVVTEITEGEYAGGVSYTFEIHEAAVWDNGTPVTAADVVFTFKALFNPKVPADHFKVWLESVKDIQTYPDNPKKLTFLLKEKYILSEVTVGNVTVIPAYQYDPNSYLADIPLKDFLDEKKVEKLAETDERLTQFADEFMKPQFAQNVYGSGPYELIEYTTGQRIVLKKKANWWGDKLADKYDMLRAYPDQIEYRIFTDQVASVTAMRNNEVDIIASIDAKEFIKLREEPNLQQLYNFNTPNTYIYYFINLNRRNEILADKSVRQALAHLVNVDQIIDKMFDGLAERRVGPIDHSKPYYDKTMQPIPYDLAKAKQLLADAGWKDTNGNGVLDKELNGERKELIIEYVASSNSKFAASLAPLVKEQAKPAGIQVDFVTKEYSAVAEDMNKRNYGMAGAGFGGDAILDDLKQILHTSSDTPTGSNRAGFGDAKSDALIDAIRIELDETKRNAMYKELQQLIYEDQPMIFLFAPKERIAISKCFETTTSQIRPGYYVPHFKKK